MTKLETAFTAELLKNLAAAAALTGVEEARLRQQAEKLGGPKAVKELIARGQMTRAVSAAEGEKKTGSQSGSPGDQGEICRAVHR